MKDADKTIQNTIEEGGEEEPPLEVSDSEMDFDNGGCDVHILLLRRNIFPRNRPLVWFSSGDNLIHYVPSI